MQNALTLMQNPVVALSIICIALTEDCFYSGNQNPWIDWVIVSKNLELNLIKTCRVVRILFMNNMLLLILILLFLFYEPI